MNYQYLINYILTALSPLMGLPLPTLVPNCGIIQFHITFHVDLT